jgi:hypothetical protein
LSGYIKAETIPRALYLIFTDEEHVVGEEQLLSI